MVVAAAVRVAVAAVAALVISFGALGRAPVVVVGVAAVPVARAVRVLVAAAGAGVVAGGARTDRDRGGHASRFERGLRLRRRDRGRLASAASGRLASAFSSASRSPARLGRWRRGRVQRWDARRLQCRRKRRRTCRRISRNMLAHLSVHAPAQARAVVHLHDAARRRLARGSRRMRLPFPRRRPRTSRGPGRRTEA